MKHLFSVAALLLICSVHAQSPLIWTGAVQGQGDVYEDAFSVTVDNDNNLYVTGYFSSDSVTFGNLTLHNSGTTDAFIVKYDIQMNPVWAKSIGGSGEEYGMAITCDSSDRIVVVGNYSSSSVILGNDTLINQSSSTPDMFIARMDVNGNFIWARSEGGGNWDNCAGVDMNPFNGDIYVSAAYYLDTMIIGNDTMYNRGGYDMVLMKFDINGNYLWSQNAGGNFNDLANAVAYDVLNDVVIISGGFASDTLIFPTDTLLNPAMGLPKTFVVKYDPFGNCIWARRSGAGDNDHSVAVDVDFLGQIYVGGHYHSTSFIFANDTLFNQGQGDVYLLAYDMNGNPLWAKSAGGPEQDFGYSIFVNNAGVIYYAGMYSSLSITFGPYTLNNSNINEDMFLIAYNSSGTEVNSLTTTGLGTDYINSVVATNTDVYMAGSFGTPSISMGNTLTNFDPTGNTSDPFVAGATVPLSVQSNVRSGDVVFVYPNPSDGIFNFTSGMTGTVEISVFNSVGSMILTKSESNASSFQLDLTAYPEGCYTVQLFINGEYNFIRVIR